MTAIVDFPTAHACRIAVAHVLTLPPGPALNRWTLNLMACERALLEADSPPRPGLADLDVLRALREAEQAA